MGHFAKVENGVVTQVIVADQGFINTGAVGDPSSWVQTSYNTRGNRHYGEDGQQDNGEALRGNYAGIGYVYDNVNDVFYPASPFPSWLISSETNWIWTAPVAQPEAIEGKFWSWNEETTSWVSNDMPELPQ
jgi:hypothetical protein